jgi:hypothetical protein
LCSGVVLVADDDEQVVPAADAAFEGGATEHDAVIQAMRVKYRASPEELIPAVIEPAGPDVSAFGLDQPVAALGVMSAPQVGPGVLLSLGRLRSGGRVPDVQGPAVLDVPCLAKTHQRAAGPLGHRHAQPVAEGPEGAGFGALFEYDVRGQSPSGVVVVQVGPLVKVQIRVQGRDPAPISRMA